MKTSVQRVIHEQVYDNGDSYFADLLQDLANARHSIELETYIFENDTLGRQVAGALISAAHRGVDVRVLVDGVGSADFQFHFLPAMLASGVEVRIYHPVPWKLWWVPFSRFPSFKKFFELLSKINRRDHRKLYVVDRRVAWLGSMNIDAKHLPRINGKAAWRDTGLRVSDSRVGALVAAFEMAWREAWAFGRVSTGPSSRVRGWLRKRRMLAHPLVRLNDTRLRRRQLYLDLLRRIQRARRRVWITNAYFVPRPSLVRALCEAATRGVDVRLLLPRQCDVFFIPWVSRAFYGQLLAAGIRVFEYQRTILHTKTMLIDDWSIVGSTNLNHRSMIHDLEVDVVLTTSQGRLAVERHFRGDLNDAALVTSDYMRQRPWFTRVFCRILLLMKHWL